MPKRYTAIPSIPTSGVPPLEGAILNALRENVELLTGQRRGDGLDSASLTRSDITLQLLGNPSITRVTAEGRGFEIEGQKLASLEDMVKLIVDVQNAVNDLIILRNTVNELISQLRG